MANAPVAYIDSGKPGNPAYNTCRNFSFLNGVNQFIPVESFDLSGDFQIDFMINKASVSTSAIVGTNVVSPDLFYIGFTGSQLLIGNGTDNIAAGTLNSGTDYHVVWKSVSGTITALIDGVSVYSAARAGSPSTDVTDIGRITGGAFYANATIWDVNIYTGSGDPGLLIRSYRIDEGFGADPIIRNSIGSVGPEIWSYGEPVTVPQIAQFNTVAGSFGDANITNGDSFVWSFTISNMTATGKLNFIFGGGPNTVFEGVAGNGRHNISVPNASAQALVIQEAAASFGSEGVIISGIRVNKTEGGGKLENSTTAVWSEVCE